MADNEVVPDPAGREISAKLPKQVIEDLIKKSADAKKKAYARYSKFRVGAALLTESGQIFTGCNVENCAYPLCTCAERTAIVKAVSEGHTAFKAIAVSTDTEEKHASPCGNCRQVMSEFADKSNYWVIMTKPDGSYRLTTVDELLPHSFRSDDLQQGQRK